MVESCLKSKISKVFYKYRRPGVCIGCNTPTYIIEVLLASDDFSEKFRIDKSLHPDENQILKRGTFCIICAPAPDNVNDEPRQD